MSEDKVYDLFEDLSLIMKGLVVEEECERCEGTGAISVNMALNPNVFSDMETHPCTSCHGTGKIIRPATPQEVREFLELVLEWNGKPIEHRTQVSQVTTITFLLKSGAVLRMEDEK